MIEQLCVAQQLTAIADSVLLSIFDPMAGP